MKNILGHTLLFKIPSVVFYLLLFLVPLGRFAKHEMPVSIVFGVMICSFFYGIYERQEPGKKFFLAMAAISGALYSFRTVLYVIELVELLVSRL